MDPMFTDAAAALLADHCPPATVRAIEAGTPATALWQALADAGFADALVPEARGGAGLPLADVFGVWALCGQHALPLPLAETMLARALLAEAGLDAPDGAIALATGRLAGGRLRAHAVPGARTAAAVLVSDGLSCRLLATGDASAERAPFVLDATLSWPAAAWDAAPALPQVPELRTLQALVTSVQLAGALMATFERTLQYANERQQFGKPIGKFQAIQHQLSVMAEEAFASRMAAQLACDSPRATAPDRLRVAAAKARTGEAALTVAELAHSIHGAIGFTAEFDLQLLTRRLHAWRQAAGSESAWQDVLGAALVDGGHGLTVDLLRQMTDPAPAA